MLLEQSAKKFNKDDCYYYCVDLVRHVGVICLVFQVLHLQILANLGSKTCVAIEKIFVEASSNFEIQTFLD